MNLRLIGIGTAHGDDAAGLLVVEQLALEGLPPEVSSARCERPGVDLADLLRGADAAVLVDAMRSGRALGSVRRVALDDIRSAPGLSIHAMGVAEGLALARALDRCPASLALVGIEASPEPHEGLSQPVAQAVPAAMGLVRSLMTEVLARHERRTEIHDA